MVFVNLNSNRQKKITLRKGFTGILTQCRKRTTSGRTPANAVVVEVLAALRAKHLDHHTVEVEALHQHPGEGAQEEEVK